MIFFTIALFTIKKSGKAKEYTCQEPKFTLQTWTLSVEQGPGPVATALWGWPLPLPYVFLGIPLMSVHQPAGDILDYNNGVSKIFTRNLLPPQARQKWVEYRRILFTKVAKEQQYTKKASSHVYIKW